MTSTQFKPFDFHTSLTAEGLNALDEQFIAFLSRENPTLIDGLKKNRTGELNALETSEWIIETAPILEKFIAQLFQIEPETKTLFQKTHESDPIFIFQDYFVHHAKRLLKTVTDISQFNALNDWLAAEQNSFRSSCESMSEKDMELTIAKLGIHFLSNENKYKTEIEKLIQWCALATQCDEGKKLTHHWKSFHIPAKTHFDNLVPLVEVKNDSLNRCEGPIETQRPRDGFALTDNRKSLRDVMSEIHYCVYCHKNEGDFCSKGFPVKKNQPELGFKINPTGETLTGCPLEEKISEMHTVKKNGFGIGALAIVTIDNPMCAVTGHRICNDCMKACIYQKQEPVNIPEIETRVLTDVLDLPWGVEIYDLFIRWNPLRQTQFTPKYYNGKKILVMGMGPAGFTAAHHLLMEGCAVVGCDGLKIEPLPEKLLTQPIKYFKDICESLDDRIMSGFGGVSEYGITVRWDKNFLKLIYLSLVRRQYFQLLGNIRFGGTITVESAWEMGFDHIAIAVGAGLSRELPIPNSLAVGMRQANDFLMTLQLTGAIKKNSLANLQVRLPAIVIGGGLTGVDTATEAQAYYIVQVEKIHQRYHILKSHIDETDLRNFFDTQSLEILDEYLAHAEKIIAERDSAQREDRKPNFIKLLREWGGVTIVYRKNIQNSPAYQRNHEELIKALEEGIYYAQDVEPVSAVLDHYGATTALTCRTKNNEEKIFPAKSIFVATGAKPNIAYEFEHRGTFERQKDAYQTFSQHADGLQTVHEIGNVKTDNFGIFTSYAQHDSRVSFLGDTHPVFHGSVVKAIASAKRGYPKIMSVLSETRASACVKKPVDDYTHFSNKIKKSFTTHVIAINRHTKNMLELIVHAPTAAQQCHAGQFYRIQNYEVHAKSLHDTTLLMEGVAALGIPDEKNPDQLSFFIAENGASSKLISTLKIGEPIALMGPTGAKTKMSPNNTILIVGNTLAIPFLFSVAHECKAENNNIIFVGMMDDSEKFAVEKINKMTKQHYFCDDYKNVVDQLKKIDLKNIQEIFVIGDAEMLRAIQAARKSELKFNDNAKCTASVYGSMQCMLKGVCAQCLQWQIDPSTSKRTKAVYACSWQHQPIQMVDIDHLDHRMQQNKMQETLTNLWVDYLFQSS